ncbi:MAG: beta-galactosidase [Kiritimatiellae bacterium]|nr:beta-galactosidase [Kiritimatiellia bacterium]
MRRTAFARVPRAYWRHRIKMCKALGLNAVCAYMFWNYHEMERGKFDFSGEKDVAEFCRIAQEEGMWVVLRPGPYTCAEWEFGGLPWWLLENGPIRLRSRDPRFLEPAKAYLKRVGEELKDLQITHGGPILMVQDENEYGFFGDDGEYIRELYKTLREAGFDVPVFTCNAVTLLDKGAIPEVVKVVNFGSNPKNAFAKLREVQPKGPLMCGEYYPAWFDSWGQRHHTKPAQAMLNDIDYMLSKDGSFSLYMAHGGTTFGWWAGCNSPFQPQTSSYDYEAPISEQGRVTPKFFALRDLLKKYMTRAERSALPQPPEPIPLQAFESDAAAELVTPQLRMLKANMEKPLPFEKLGVGYGAVVYSHTGDMRKGGMLKVPNLRDQAAVYCDGELAGFIDRRFPNRGVRIPRGTATLHILVTHMSRYNFGAAMNNTEKGLLAPVTIDGVELSGWNAQELVAPVEGELFRVASHPFNFKRFRVEFASTADTFLLVRGWKKGHVWVNGHPLGRFWGIGPTQTMYVPGCWLREGENEFVVFDFGGNVPAKGLVFTDTPVLDEMHPECDFIAEPHRESEPFEPPANPTLRGEFPDGAEARTVKLPAPAAARRIAFIVDSDWSGKNVAAIAEFELLDAKGASIPHDKWRFVSVSSEETAQEDGSADNAIDGQISNFWHSRWSKDEAKAPHYLVIDLGEETEISGFRYTPRQNMNNGRVRSWRFHVL